MSYLRNDPNKQERIAKKNKRHFFFLSTVVYRRDNSLVSGWKDKRIVTYLTTNDETGMKTIKRMTRDGVEMMIKKPNIILNNIKYMGGVDRGD